MENGEQLNYGFKPRIVFIEDSVCTQWARAESTSFAYFWDRGEEEQSSRNYGSFRTLNNGFQYKIDAIDNGWVATIYALK